MNEMAKIALGDTLTTAYNTKAGKTREAGQKPVMHGKRKVGTTPIEKFARDRIAAALK